jgi:biopolymer transport protein ExbD
MKRKRRQTHDPVEMQMGPMIDIVFLLLVFFLVTARPIKQESDISMQLPGTVEQSESLDIPDEQIIQILSDGRVVLNEAVYDSPDSREMPELTATLTRFKKVADSSMTEAMVTLDAEDGARHQRIVDVLNAVAKAGITGVTFTPESGEGPTPGVGI